MQRRVIRRTAAAFAVTAVVFSLFASAAPGLTHKSATPVQVWLTDLGTASRLAPQPALSFGAAAAVDSSTIAVDEKRTYQSMVGFGASITDSSATLMANSLAPGQRAALMTELFDPSAGIGLDMLRQPMGASDFSSVGNYSYDDQPPGGSDPTLGSFSIGHDLPAIIPLLQQARALNPKLSIVATPWSPPGWMKTSDSMVGGTLKPEDFSVLAQYFAHFLQAYEAQGVHVNYVTPQNEPLYIPGGYPGMGMVPGDQQAFIRDYLHPAIAATGLKTQVLAYDHNWEVPGYPETIYSDAAAAAATPGTAWHCYAGDVAAQTAVHDAYPNEDAHLTECSGGEWQGSDQQAFDLTMGLLVNAPRNYAKDVVLWNLALDQDNGPTNNGCLTCRGVVTIDTSGGTATVTKNVDYYALGHLSKFVLPGAVRIGSTTLADGSVEDVAFRNQDGSKVLVAHNTTSSPRTFKVLWGKSSFGYTLNGGAAATFRWNDAQQGATVGYDDIARSVDIPFDNPDGTKVNLTYDASQQAFQNGILSGSKQFTYTAPVGSSIGAGGAETLLSRSGWTATASSTSPYGDVTSRAIDGDLSTRWSGGHGMANGDWFQVDMGSPQTFSGLLVDSAGSTGDFARGYKVYVSNDGTSWGTAIAYGAGGGQLTKIVFAPVTARYVRVVQTGGAGNWWSIHEFNAFLATAHAAPAASVQEKAFKAPDGSAGKAIYNPATTPVSVNVDLWSGQSLVYTLPPRGAAIFTWTGAHGGQTAAPVLSSVSPAKGFPGEAVVLSGSGFGATEGASTVLFGTTAASILHWSDTSVTAQVPAMAAGATTVSISVTGRTSGTKPFTVLSLADALPRAGWTATASSTDPYGDVTSNAIDGNNGTRWSSGHGMTNGDWFQVDMGSVQSFSRIAMDSASSSGDYARGYQVVVSNDGTTWSAPVASGTGSGPLVVASFPTQTARYVRVIQTGESGSWWSIAEFYAFA